MKGRAIAYSAEELAFVRDLQDMPRAVLYSIFAEVFGRVDVRVEHLIGLCKRHGWSGRVPWTAEQDALLCQHYPHRPTATVADLVGHAVAATYRRARALGLSKTDTYLASPAAGRLHRGDARGAATRYQGGHTPANKGLTGRRGWAPGRMREHQFTAGQSGWNWKPVGSERVIGGYRFTKISDRRRVSWTVNWRQTHILNWEALHGPVPDGHALKSIDGDRLNVSADNWQLVPRGMLPSLNGRKGTRVGYDKAPDELKPTVMVLARLSHAITSRRRRAAMEAP